MHVLWRTRVVSALVSLFVMVGAVLGLAGTAHAGPNEGDLFSAVNAARASAGLPPYSYAADLATAARGQAERMAASGELYHNPNLGTDVTGWARVGENAAHAGDWRSAHEVLMNSPAHRAQILDPGYTQMGVGTAVAADGTLWVAQVFRTPIGSSAGSGAASGGGTSPSGASDASGPPGSPVSPTESSGGQVTAPAAPTPEQILRQNVREAREQVQRRAKGRDGDDPLLAALDYSTVMDTVSG